MSTPPRVELPDGVVVERWPVRGSERAVMHAGLDGATAWALLVPGFTGSKEDFIAVLPILAAAGFGGVTFDQLGQHESDGSDLASDYAIDRLASDVAEVAALAAGRTASGAPPHLLGHSMGGLVAQEAVAGGRLRPASLVLMCSGPGALPADRWRELPALVAALDQHDLATIWSLIQELEREQGTPAPPADVGDFLSRRWHGNSPTQLRTLALLLMEQPSLTTRVRAATVDAIPVVVMWGELDDRWPLEVQRRMAEELEARVVVLPDVGHSPNAQDPAAMADALVRGWGA